MLCLSCELYHSWFCAMPIQYSASNISVVQKILTNEAMKPPRLKDHQTRLHPDKVDKPIAFFEALKEC